MSNSSSSSKLPKHRIPIKKSLTNLNGWLLDSFIKIQCSRLPGLNNMYHRHFHQPGQDLTPKFAGQVLPDRTESGHKFLKFYLTSISCLFLYNKVINLVSKNLHLEVFFFFLLFLKMLKVRKGKRPVSGHSSF